MLATSSCWIISLWIAGQIALARYNTVFFAVTEDCTVTVSRGIDTQ
jgi:hypothetical protein